MSGTVAGAILKVTDVSPVGGKHEPSNPIQFTRGRTKDQRPDGCNGIGEMRCCAVPPCRHCWREARSKRDRLHRVCRMALLRFINVATKAGTRTNQYYTVTSVGSMHGAMHDRGTQHWIAIRTEYALKLKA